MQKKTALLVKEMSIEKILKSLSKTEKKEEVLI